MKISEIGKTIIIFGAGLALGLLTSFFIFQKVIPPLPPNLDESFYLTKTREAINASLMIDFQDGQIITCLNQKLKPESNVFDLLLTCSKNPENPFEFQYDTHPEWGVFIKKIADKENGKDNKYWQYWVNGEYAQVGASQYKLKNKDFVEWKFIFSQF